MNNLMSNENFCVDSVFTVLSQQVISKLVLYSLQHQENLLYKQGWISNFIDKDILEDLTELYKNVKRILEVIETTSKNHHVEEKIKKDIIM